MPLECVHPDLADPDNYLERVPYDLFRKIQEADGLYWNSTPSEEVFKDAGFWVATRHRDIKYISTHPEVFSSSAKTAIIRLGPNVTADNISLQRKMMLHMDPPAHTKLRAIVSKAFTPRTVGRLRERISELARELIVRAAQKGSGNFVADIAAPLPLLAIAELIGILVEDRREVFAWADQITGFDDPELAPDSLASQAAGAQLYQYADRLAALRLNEPRDDIATSLVHADVDGRNLEAVEFNQFFLLLMVAGNETTRNAITHGMLAFFDNPDQWSQYKRNRPPTTADEIIRWASPVMNMQRTALRDINISGQEIKQGERIGMFYGAANRDPQVFEDPHRFDILRSPNPHFAFGGNGPHFCLGASLARMEIAILFATLADLLPGIEQTGAPRRLRSSLINGIKELAVRY
jgi:cholest-4-en-3-one 26-monooxygenase